MEAKINIPTITAPRLILRPFTHADVDPKNRLMSEQGVLRYFPTTNPPSQDRVQKMVSGILNHWNEHNYGLWAVESRATGALMGRSGLQYLPDTDKTEVDFLLGKAFWGQGFATEAGQAALRYGCKTLGLESIIGIVRLENKASQRALEKR